MQGGGRGTSRCSKLRSTATAWRSCSRAGKPSALSLHAEIFRRQPEKDTGGGTSGTKSATVMSCPANGARPLPGIIPAAALLEVSGVPRLSKLRSGGSNNLLWRRAKSPSYRGFCSAVFLLSAMRGTYGTYALPASCDQGHSCVVIEDLELLRSRGRPEI